MAEPIINLTRGVPPPEVFPTKDLIQCGEAALRRDPNVLLQYGHSPGYTPLREWLGQRYGVGPDQILMANSSLEIFSFITQTLLQPGDRAFVESPSYDRSITLLRRAGAQVVGIPMEEDGLNLAVLEDELEKGVPTLMYLIADFQNPTGLTTSMEKRRRLATLAEEYGFWITEDAPYRALRYVGQDVPTLRSLAPTRVLHMSSFSKVLAPGLRLGYVVGPAEAIATLARWAVDTYIGPVFPTQGMVYEYCCRGLLEPNIERLKEAYRPRLQATFSALEKHLPQATWTRPEGGFFVGVTLPEGSDMASLLARTEEAGLKLSDGRGFFPNPPDGNRFLRFPFCNVTPEEIEEGMSRLARIL
ncbi:MAG: PLP-dependent aminotransferase family protein [Anaerolineales bacterium]|nr:PLP-dependent aminotransferase family protein [Anaerolineales bacterium]